MNKFIIYFIPLIVILFAGIYFLSTKNKVEPTSQNQRIYTMDLISKPDNIVPGQTIKLVYVIKNEKGDIVTKFEIAHEKIMHFIVVRKDLQDFAHLHPVFNQSTGEFSVDVIFPNNGPYRIFPDFTPGEDNPQKLPVTVFSDIEVGNTSAYSSIALSTDTENKKPADGYEITYLFPKDDQLRAQKELTYSLLVEENGQPVTNLENYLGAKGHSVIIKEKTLDYIHTHALEENEELEQAVHGGEHVAKQKEAVSQGNQIDFSTTLPETGIYKIFTQFQHEGKIITSDYVIQVI